LDNSDGVRDRIRDSVRVGGRSSDQRQHLQLRRITRIERVHRGAVLDAFLHTTVIARETRALQTPHTAL
jgi:hypothetical protein